MSNNEKQILPPPPAAAQRLFDFTDRAEPKRTVTEEKTSGAIQEDLLPAMAAAAAAPAIADPAEAADAITAVADYSNHNASPLFAEVQSSEVQSSGIVDFIPKAGEQYRLKAGGNAHCVSVNRVGLFTFVNFKYEKDNQTILRSTTTINFLGLIVV